MISHLHTPQSPSQSSLNCTVITHWQSHFSRAVQFLTRILITPFTAIFHLHRHLHHDSNLLPVPPSLTCTAITHLHTHNSPPHSSLTFTAISHLQSYLSPAPSSLNRKSFLKGKAIFHPHTHHSFAYSHSPAYSSLNFTMIGHLNSHHSPAQPSLT
jgi:hypothetical protein